MDEIEHKAFDVTSSPSCDITIPLTLLNGIQRGDDDTERLGRSTSLRTLEVKGYVSAGSAETFARIIIFYDHQSNGAAPLSSELLYPMRTYGMYPRGSSRFDVLYDQEYHVNASTEVDSLAPVNIRIPLFNQLVVYNSGSTGTVADISTGALYIATVGNNAAGATAPTFIFTSRVHFTDT